MGIRSILASIFGSNDEQVKDTSPGQIAADRLKFIVITDRANISPGMLEKMKMDIIEVIKRYVDIDETQINLELAEEDNSVALVANIPIRTVPRKRGRA